MSKARFCLSSQCACTILMLRTPPDCNRTTHRCLKMQSCCAPHSASMGPDYLRSGVPRERLHDSQLFVVTLVGAHLVFGWRRLPWGHSSTRFKAGDVSVRRIGVSRGCRILTVGSGIGRFPPRTVGISRIIFWVVRTHWMPSSAKLVKRYGLVGCQPSPQEQATTTPRGSQGNEPLQASLTMATRPVEDETHGLRP